MRIAGILQIENLLDYSQRTLVSGKRYRLCWLNKPILSLEMVKVPVL